MRKILSKKWLPSKKGSGFIGSMNKKWIWISCLLALGGIVLASFLLSEHVHYIQEGYKGDSFCSVNTYINCEAVDQSHFSEVWGIPVSGLAIVYFTITLGFGLLLLGSKAKMRTLGFLLMLNWGGLIVCLAMAAISLFIVHALCLFCTGIYLVGILSFLSTWLATGLGSNPIPFTLSFLQASFGGANNLGFPTKILPSILVSLILFLGGALGLKAINLGVKAEALIAQQKKQLQDKNREFSLEDMLKIHFAQPVLSLDPRGHPYWGNKEAKVVIAEFSDFQCPFCGKAAQILHPALKKFEDKIVFYFINYPLDQSCNPQITHPMHENACNAAKAGICADEKGKFWEMHDLLFKNQQDLKLPNILSLATSIGLNTSELTRCMQSKDTQEQILEDTETAKGVQVQGTPSIFINGRLARAWTDPEALDKIVEEEIKRAESK